MISTGGDELNTNCYAQDPETQQILISTGQTLEQALDSFTKTTHGALEQLGKTTVVWEGSCNYLQLNISLLTSCAEMVLDHNVTLSNNTIVM